MAFNLAAEIFSLVLQHSTDMWSRQCWALCRLLRIVEIVHIGDDLTSHFKVYVKDAQH